MNQNIILALVAVFAIVGVSTLAVSSTMIGAPTTNEVEYVTVDANAIDVDSLTIGFIPVECEFSRHCNLSSKGRTKGT